MISRDEALSEALAALDNRTSQRALAFIALAAELREQPTSPELRLTLHDVEARICEHELFSVRDRRASTSWWLHVDGQTSCDQP